MVNATNVLKLAASIVCLSGAILLGLYVYCANQSRQLSQRTSMEAQAIGSREGLQVLRELMGLAPLQLDCGKGELLVSMAYFRCDLAGSIQARVRPEGVAAYEGYGHSGYAMDGIYKAQHNQRLSPKQRVQLSHLVGKWPKFDPEADPSRTFHLSRMTAMLVCKDGRQYGIPSLGGQQANDPDPNKEFLQVLGAVVVRDPEAGDVICIH
ncbi:MAG TPA: hypothetical protein VM512_11705 [Burkholderiaceae bacterium]|jgi:hypothetical protein|nr:hypothetical protein [Burkholderiaceae bacterium]